MREQNFHQAPQASAKAPQASAKAPKASAKAPKASAKAPQASSKATASAKVGSLVGPQTVNSESDSLPAVDAQDAFIDPALDRLLARAQAPELRAGFAERVIHSVRPTSVQTWKQAWQSFPLRALGLAAALALCTGALLWTNIWTNNSPQPPHSPLLQGTSPEAEHLLIAALRSPELSGDDLALVANLREVLEAELIANHPLWLDEK